jgi:pre-mRNA-splicing factor RBM22/SLT11
MQRNRAQLCSFFARGECNRGAECPYRHEMPQSGELAEQNIRDRYYGINDPVARKMMRRLGERAQLEPPEDPEIKTLYVGNIEKDWKEDDFCEVFDKHGDVTAVRIVHAKSCAFVTYSSRQVCSAAAMRQAALSCNGHPCCSDVHAFVFRPDVAHHCTRL